jgi:hypothetical protein
LQRGHPLYPLRPFYFLGIDDLLFLFHGAHVDLAQVPGLIEVFV